MIALSVSEIGTQVLGNEVIIVIWGPARFGKPAGRASLIFNPNKIYDRVFNEQVQASESRYAGD
jgi:hypothetical protein